LFFFFSTSQIIKISNEQQKQTTSNQFSPISSPSFH
jgi:hypothetical protein